MVEPCFEAYIARCNKCGGMVAAVMDKPEHKKDVAKEVAGLIKAGFAVSRVTNKKIRVHKWCTCK